MGVQKNHFKNLETPGLVQLPMSPTTSTPKSSIMWFAMGYMLLTPSLGPTVPRHDHCRSLSLLLGHTDGTTAAARCLGVLSTDTEAPVVSETTVSTDLL